MGANGSQSARELYSGLRFLIDERGLTIADLARRVAAQGETVDARTLRRLADPDRPLKLVDTRVLDAVCRALGIGIGDLLVFAPTLGTDLRRLPEERQRRLGALMDAHAEGELAPDQRLELEALVAEADDLDFANARRLVEHRELVRASNRPRSPSAAD